MMRISTVQPLGTHDLAGSITHPTTYRIRSCPKCYGVLYWMNKRQTSETCDNCGTVVLMLDYAGPVDYARGMIRNWPFAWVNALFALYALAQVLDYRLHLRKRLLFAFIRGLSYL